MPGRARFARFAPACPVMPGHARSCPVMPSEIFDLGGQKRSKSLKIAFGVWRLALIELPRVKSGLKQPRFHSPTNT